MNTREAIEGRRSIRRFAPDPVDRALIRQVLEAGAFAPSAKNRQPWRFVVVSAESREAMAQAMREGLDWREAHLASEEERWYVAGARQTLSIMEGAPVNIFIVNPHGKHPAEPLSPYGERFLEMANVQSIGAAIQNMCLAAHDLGLGTLWIADVYDAYPTLSEWLATPGVLTAALSLGYPAEAPDRRPRKAVDAVTTWR